MEFPTQEISAWSRNIIKQTQSLHLHKGLLRSLQRRRTLLELSDHLRVANVCQAALGGLKLRRQVAIEGAHRLCFLQVGADLRLHTEDLGLRLTEILQDITDALGTLGIRAGRTTTRLEGLDEIAEGLEQALGLGRCQGKALGLPVGGLPLCLNRRHGAAIWARNRNALAWRIDSRGHHTGTAQSTATAGYPAADAIAQRTTGVGTDTHLILHTLGHEGIVGRTRIDYGARTQGYRPRTPTIIAATGCNAERAVAIRNIHEYLIAGLRHPHVQGWPNLQGLLTAIPLIDDLTVPLQGERLPIGQRATVEIRAVAILGIGQLHQLLQIPLHLRDCVLQIVAVDSGIIHLHRQLFDLINQRSHALQRTTTELQVLLRVLIALLITLQIGNARTQIQRLGIGRWVIRRVGQGITGGKLLTQLIEGALLLQHTAEPGLKDLLGADTHLGSPYKAWIKD